jgi:hypothetical protein
MILEIDTSILDRIPNLSINQLVFLTLVLSDIKNINQDIQKLLSLVNEEEIQELESRNLITTSNVDNTNVISKTSYLDELLKEDKSMFDEFYDQFPVYVIRPDGTKGFLRANVNKCRKEYNRIVGKSKAMHEHIMNCLRFEIDNKMLTGKIGYMKTMWKWLTQHEWETCEEQMKVDQPIISNDYGANIY